MHNWLWTCFINELLCYMVNTFILVYLGMLMGITNSIATIPGFVGPQVVGWITKDQVSHTNIVFTVFC